MIYDVSVNEYADVDIEFTNTNIERIITALKQKDKYTKKEIQKIEDALNKLGTDSQEFSIEGYINSVDLTEDSIEDAYKEIHCEGTYDEGYDDGISHIKKYKQNIKIQHACLLQKLERLVYNYGNPEPLTFDELKTIKNLLDYEYEDGRI